LQTKKLLLRTYAAVASVNPTVGLATLRRSLTSLVEMFFTTATIGMETSVRTLTAASTATTNLVQDRMTKHRTSVVAVKVIYYLFPIGLLLGFIDVSSWLSDI
jgi:hypothetical protein